MKPMPIAIQRQGDEQLLIDWNDGETRVYKAYDLLKACPCAVCAEKKQQSTNGLNILAQEDTQQIKLLAMRPVGRYAYHLDFNTGCDNGIFTLEYLKTLGEPVSNQAPS